MESRPSCGACERWLPLVVIVFALAGASPLARSGGDGGNRDPKLARPSAPRGHRVARAVAPARAHTRRVQHVPPPPWRAQRLSWPQPPEAIAAPRGVRTASSTLAVDAKRAQAQAAAPTAPDETAGDPAGDSARLEPLPTGPPPEALAASNVATTTTATTAQVTWETNFPTTSQGADAIGVDPVVWTPRDTSAGSTHSLEFTNLQPATTYHLWLHDVDDWNRLLTTPLTVTTAPPPARAEATVRNGAILVNGAPFFPLTTWNTCTNFIPSRLALGFNLFMAEGCGHERALAASLDGKAYAVVDAKTKLAGQPGVIGWYYPDELDGRLRPPLSAADVTSMAVTPPDGMLRFLTLTNHFFTGAAPLPIGRAVYPAFVSLADVVGFDIYPMQNWCRNDAYQVVYDAQRELEALAAGKPTFQWIEVRKMDCGAALSPTPTTVAAETWLAIAGGADGIGYFPDEWSSAVGDEIQALNARITDLAPALLAPDVNATAPGGVKVGARTLNGALYVIAVNSSTAPFDVQLQVDGAGSRTFDVLGEGRQVTAVDNAISDHFDGLGVHVYIASPDGWTPAPVARR